MANNQQLLLGEGAGGAPVVYVEDVFSTYLYTGTGAALTITNNIDLSTKGGMVWIKQRDAATYTHNLVDTARGFDKYLYSPATTAQDTVTTRLQSFNSTGFSLGSNLSVNGSGNTMASWTFRKQPKFFDIVTYTGTGSNTTIAHNLGSVPGCIIVKRTDTSAAWAVYHRSLANTQYLVLNTTAAAATGATRWNSTTPTSAVFSLGTDASVNASGGTYVAYIYAHDAGGFGLAGTDNVISCGSFTTDGSGKATITLGYEPQWIMAKASGASENWYLLDNMRGLPVDGTEAILQPNGSNAEASSTNFLYSRATGFVAGSSGGSNLSVSTSYIYVAIRRGPMKVPTVGTSVFSPVLRTATTAIAQVTSVGFAPDVHLCSTTDVAGNYHPMVSRLRGAANQLYTNRSNAESAQANTVTSFNMNGISLGSDSLNYYVNNAGAGAQRIDHFFKRAPGFFDEVCYTVTGFAANDIAHNLTVTPELFITKPRGSTGGWSVYGSILGATTKYMSLQADTALQTSGGAVWAATSSTFSEPSTAANGTYVCYLFATCAGVSKVGSYTGNGSNQTIACGFTAGSRFVLIKRTDSTGDWYVWDSARGIIAGNDPHLSLNTTAAEVTTDDSVDTDNSGFIVNQLAATNVNVTSATYIFLAIA